MVLEWPWRACWTRCLEGLDGFGERPEGLEGLEGFGECLEGLEGFGTFGGFWSVWSVCGLANGSFESQ